MASVDGGVAHLVNFKEFDNCTIPVNLLPPGIKAGNLITIKSEVKNDADESLREQILKLQDDISVFLRSRQK